MLAKRKHLGEHISLPKFVQVYLTVIPKDLKIYTCIPNTYKHTVGRQI